MAWFDRPAASISSTSSSRLVSCSTMPGIGSQRQRPQRTGLDNTADPILVDRGCV